MKKIVYPKGLSRQAKEKYKTVIELYPDPDALQLTYAEVFAESYDTYLSAKHELNEYVKTHNSLNCKGSAGQLTAHPSLKTQQQAIGQMKEMGRALRMSLNKDQSEEQEETAGNRIDNIADQLRDII